MAVKTPKIKSCGTVFFEDTHEKTFWMLTEEENECNRFTISQTYTIERHIPTILILTKTLTGPNSNTTCGMLHREGVDQIPLDLTEQAASAKYEALYKKITSMGNKERLP